jgi:hypothetical protein
MTWEEFYGEVMILFTDALGWKGNAIRWHSGTPDHYEVKWCTGGTSGGSCWGDSAEHFTSDDPEAELELLDALLEAVCPTISVMKYKKLLKAVVERDSDSEGEYYGNYTDYGIKRVNFRKLYDELKALEVI